MSNTALIKIKVKPSSLTKDLTIEKEMIEDKEIINEREDELTQTNNEEDQDVKTLSDSNGQSPEAKQNTSDEENEKGPPNIDGSTSLSDSSNSLTEKVKQDVKEVQKQFLEKQNSVSSIVDKVNSQFQTTVQQHLDKDEEIQSQDKTNNNSSNNGKNTLESLDKITSDEKINDSGTQISEETVFRLIWGNADKLKYFHSKDYYQKAWEIIKINKEISENPSTLPCKKASERLITQCERTKEELEKYLFETLLLK